QTAFGKKRKLPESSHTLNLIEQAKKGDEVAWNALQKQYHAPLTAFCKRFFRQEDEAEDAVQVVFIQAWKHLDSLRGETLLKSWLYRIARNVCLNRLRGKELVSLDNSVESLFEQQTDLASSVENRIITQEIIAAIMKRLDDRDRVIFWGLYHRE